MPNSIKRLSTTLSLMVILSMLLAACGGTNAVPTDTPGSTGGTAATATPGAGNDVGTPTIAPAVATNTTQPSASTGSGPKMKDANTLTVGTSADPQSLDPAWEYDTASATVVFNVYETLLAMNREKISEFVPLLASKWDISADGKTYTFTIRKGIKFHDGQDLTPSDVAYSLQRGLIQDRAAGPQWIMLQPFFGLDVLSFQADVVDKQNGKDFAKGCAAAQQAITADDSAGTVTLHLKQPYGPMLQILTGTWAAVVSKASVTKLGGWNGDCATAQKYHDPKAEASELFKVMNGTGAFKFERWIPKDQISLVRNDNYWMKDPLWAGAPTGPAKLQRVSLKNIKEWGPRFAAFKTGDLDISYVENQYVSQVDPSVKDTCLYQNGVDWNCSTTNPNGFVKLYKGIPTSTDNVVLFNQLVNTAAGNNRIGSKALDGQGIPPEFFSDIHIRKAFNYAFDWDTYIKQIEHGEAEQALGPIINGLLGYDPKQAKYTFDLTKAAAEFKAATLKSADGKSVWDTGFKIQYVYDEGNDNRKVAGEILKANLAQINPKFVIDASAEQWPAFLKETSDGNLAIYMLGWQEDFHDPHDWVSPYLSSAGAFSGSQHFEKTLQTQLDDLINKAVASTDPAERAKLYGQLQNLSYENALDVFVDQPQVRDYHQEWVKGWYYNPIIPVTANTGLYFYMLSKGQ
jgi:peptide/nickel transport system substrate-binding protein